MKIHVDPLARKIIKENAYAPYSVDEPGLTTTRFPGNSALTNIRE